MSKSNPSEQFYTINLSDMNGYTFNTDMTYSVSYNLTSDPIIDYDRWDAEFDAMEDQTSVARDALRDMGINVK